MIKPIYFGYFTPRVLAAFGLTYNDVMLLVEKQVCMATRIKGVGLVVKVDSLDEDHLQALLIKAKAAPARMHKW